MIRRRRDVASPRDLAYPFRGRWMVQNSPADRVPSHGTTAFASSYAIDFVPVGSDGRTAPMGLTSFFRPEPAESFPGFGRRVLSPADGTVIAIHDSETDHPAYRGLPSIGYFLRQGRRIAGRWRAAAGNHVMVESRGVIIALCHLQRSSVEVQVGQRVETGDVLARCGNSGNSTEPHVHLQAFDDRDIASANAVAVSFEGELPRSSQIIAV